MPDHDRVALVERWLQLTRRVLPGVAAEHAWPIRLDHCFMRVFLDQAVGGQWDRVVARPAIRHMPGPLLARAVALAERSLAEPGILPALNAESLAWRRAQRRVGARAGAVG